MSDRFHHQQPQYYRRRHCGGGLFTQHKWEDDGLELGGGGGSAGNLNTSHDDSHNHEHELLLPIQSSLTSSSAFSSSPISFTSATRRRTARRKITNVDELHSGWDSGNGSFDAICCNASSSSNVSGISNGSAISGSSAISTTQLWMNSKRGDEINEKDDHDDKPQLQPQPQPQPQSSRTATRRKRGSFRGAVSSFISSFSPLYMITSRGSQSSFDENGQEEEGNPVQEKLNGDTTTTKKKSDMKRELSMLQYENDILRKQVNQLSQENHRLHQSHHRQRIILEQFEGEGKQMFDVNGDAIDSMWWEKNGYDNYENGTMVTMDDYGVNTNGEVADMGVTRRTDRASTMVGSSQTKRQPLQLQDQDECGPQNVNDGTCPIEPDISFRAALKDRAYWLVGLLTLQSMSGFILARNEELLQTHPVIVYFLTMLVGAGGNAGNQAAVRVIRGIALGTLNERTQRQFLQRELKMASSLSVILSLAGFIRAVAFGTPFPETVAVTSALAIIVFTSICFGAVLPLILRKIDVDPAHSSTTIQVIMDILGVVLTVAVSTTILDSPIGQVIINKLTGGGGRS